MKKLTDTTEAHIARFWSRVVKTEGCWIWTGSLTPDGYGRTHFASRRGYAVIGSHRFSYIVTLGPIPDGLVLDHLCRVRACVNPYHLEPVTQGENVRRGVMSQRASEERMSRTHCHRGHPLSGANLYRYGTHRGCVECRRIASREYRARKRQEVAA